MKLRERHGKIARSEERRENKREKIVLPAVMLKLKHGRPPLLENRFGNPDTRCRLLPTLVNSGQVCALALSRLLPLTNSRRNIDCHIIYINTGIYIILINIIRSIYIFILYTRVYGYISSEGAKVQYKNGIARPIKCYEIVWGAQVAPSLTRRPSKARVDIHVCVHVCCREDVGHAYVLLAVWRQTGLYSESQKCDGVPGWGPSCCESDGNASYVTGNVLSLEGPLFFC